MAYKLFLTVPQGHAHNRTLGIEGASTFRAQALTSGHYRCTAGSETYETSMRATLNAETGTFDIDVILEPQWRLRNVFNGGNREIVQPGPRGVSYDVAIAALENFEATSARHNLELMEGRDSLPHHFRLSPKLQAPARKFETAETVFQAFRPD